jgi:hypothetical protein
VRLPLPAAAALLAVGLLLGGPAAARAPAAGVLSLTPDGSDSGSCTRAAPCRSLGRAYRVAQPGQVVELAAGTYPGQTIAFDQAKQDVSANVVFRPAAGARVAISGELRIAARHLELQNMTVEDWYAGVNDAGLPESRQAGHLIFRDLATQGFYISGASNVSVIGGSLGPVEDAGAGAAQVKSCYQCPYPVTNILIDRVDFHDVVRTQAGEDAGIHTECLHFWGGVANVVVRNSRFSNCAIMDMFVEDDHGPAGDVHDLTVENNFFDAPGSRGGGPSRGSYSLYIAGHGGSLHDVHVRFNSFLSTAIVDTFTSDSSNIELVGNAGTRPSWQCYRGVTFSYNVWDGARCSDTDRRAGLAFVEPGSVDLHLQRSSGALAAVPPEVPGPAVDIDGQPRPLRARRDAGADQREPASIVLSSGIGSAKLGAAAPAAAALYGSPASRARVAVKGAVPLQAVAYRVPGGRLSMLVADGSVVGLRTSSPYYSTPAGLGPGARIRPPRWTRWSKCARAYVGRAGRVDVYLFAARATPQTTVRSVLLVRRGYRAVASCR